MGWCSEFGCRIAPACDHPMVAGRQSCSCDICGEGCGGRFAGCREVWAAGPKSRPARKGGSATTAGGSPSIPVVVEAVLPSEGLPTAGLQPTADSGLRSLSDTVDRMGRQLKSVVKLLNQQAASPSPSGAPAHAGAAPNGDQLVELGETVDRMGRELRGVLNLLIQQQATLARLSEAQAIAPAGSPVGAMLDAPGGRQADSLPQAYGPSGQQAQSRST